MRGKWRAQRADRGAHAARGFVGGATSFPETFTDDFRCFNAARGFVGGATQNKLVVIFTKSCFNAARGFVGGATASPTATKSVARSFNAARGYSLSPPPPLRGPPPPLAQGRLFVYGMSASLPDARDAGCCKVPSQREGLRYFSFPRRCGGSGEHSEPIGALMPHAALWVVQHQAVGNGHA